MILNRKNSFIVTLSLTLCFSIVAFAADFSGDWQGSWRSNYGQSGGASVHLNQVGNSISGNLSLTNTECGNFSGIPVSGSVSGNVVSFYGNVICSQDDSYNSLAFTQGALNGNTVSGIYTIYSDGEFWDSGTFTLSRLSTGEKIGVFRPGIGMWFLDRSANGAWNDCVTDKCINFGIQGDIPVTGDWNGDGTTKIGVFRPSIGWWFLDYNGNGQWDGCSTDRCYNFGISEDTPVTGDWNGDGKTEIGVFRKSIGWWFLDYNANGTWSGCSTDRCYNFGISIDTPVTGDWNGDGKTEIGVFRPSIGWWFVDVSGDGTWSGCGADGCYNFGISVDLPVTGDWNGDGYTEIGVYRPSIGMWFLDYNGNDTWNDCTTDRCYQFGISVDLPVSGVF